MRSRRVVETDVPNFNPLFFRFVAFGFVIPVRQLEP
jgi:hypothetical protein